MRVNVIVGGQTAEKEGTRGSAAQLASAGAVGGYSVNIVDLPDDPTVRATLTWMTSLDRCDVAIPLVPGLEGTLELVGIPFVGSGATAAGIGADKGLFNTLLQAWKMATPRFVRGHKSTVLRAADDAGLSYPRFVKPARLGASLGISKVRTEKEAISAVQVAAAHDDQLVVEEAVPESFVEVEVAAIAGETVSLSVPRQVRLPAGTDWHDTASKYSVATGLMPLATDHSAHEELLRTTRRIIDEISLGGALRMDYFVGPAGEVQVGEVNCLPGHGIASTFPRIFELGGIDRPTQFGLMIRSAFHHHAQRESAMARF
jgi:D-alanine-D-alanine ligase